MSLHQISVFVENQSGRVAEIARLLGGSGVNIRAISLADAQDFGIVRLIVDDVDQALNLLRTHQFTVHISPVLAVRVPDRPGALGEILQLLCDEGFNLGYMYGFVDHSGEHALLVFRFEDMERAADFIQKKGFSLVDEKGLCVDDSTISND